MKSPLSSAPAAIPVVEIPQERFTLSSGATLLVSRRGGAPVTAIHAHMRGGPSHDPAGKEGVAYMTGVFADQGTKLRTEEEINDLLEPAGGELSGDATGLSGTIVGDQWKLLVDIMGDVLTSPKYPAAKVARHKQRLLDRLLIERDDPRVQGGRLFRKLIYGDHWLGRPAYGTFDSVEQIEPRDLRAFHKACWVASRAVISVCGDVDPAAVRRRFERALKGWKTGRPFAPKETTFPPRATRVDAFLADRQQVHLFLGHLGIRRRDPDYPALVVMDHVLGAGPGFTNRVSRHLRDELGLAYSVSANIHGSAGFLPGTFTAYIGTSPQHVATALKGFQKEIRTIQKKLVGKNELEVAKSYLVGSFPRGFERATRRSGYMISSELHGFPDDYLSQLQQAFLRVTVEDVRRVAEKHLFPDTCCLAAAGPIRTPELKRALRNA
jgi:zinc protease